MRNRNRARTSVPPELILRWGALIFASGKSSSALSAQIRRHALALAVGAAFAQGAYALPTGGVVVSGSSTITTPSATSMVVNQSTTKSIINWQGFNTSSNESVRIATPTGGSSFYRVADPVSFYGALSSNGQVFLSSPGGILFGAGSMVDVGGIVATTLSMSNADFNAGRYVFTNQGATGSVVNQGTIITATGGYAALIGPNVSNEGIISAQMGTVALAAGNKVTLDMIGDGLVKVVVDEAALNASVMNKGTLEANGGNVLLTARSANALLDTVINTDGVIRANTISERNGSIVLDGGDKGVVSVAGSIEARAIDAGTTGGTVKVLGDKVGLVGNANIDASGDAGGGTVLIGGNYRGQGPEHNSSATFMSSDSTISADAVTSGNGGKVIVWSNDATRAYGSISARGGAQSGNGGFVEVSGRNWLDFAARVDTTAPNGATGTLLLDPTDITISGGVTSGGTCPAAGPCFDLAGDPNSANLNAADLIAALGTTNVTVSTSSGGSGAGDINVAAGVVYGSPNALTLSADRDLNMLTFGGSIVSNGAGALRLEAGRDFNLRDAAVLAIAGPLSVSAGGNVNVTAVTQPTLIQASTLNMNVVGGLRVQAGLAPTARASVSSLNGQTINAGFVEVTAQGNNTADITNVLSGNQLITTSGANAAGEGIVVRNLGGTNNVAMIRQGAAGASQLISVNDADALNVNGIGGNAIISNNGGMQIISVTGATSANAINIGSTGALGASQIVGGSQSITAGASGESGSISIVGSAANSRLAGFVSQPGLGNFQTLSTSGMLSVTGGSASAQLPNFPAGIFHNGTGQQRVTAAGIVLQGGSSGNGNFASISSVGGGNPLASGDQVIDVAGGSISLTGGTVGNSNRAQIFSSANQAISGNPDITLTGGASGGAVNLSNHAIIASGVNKLQSINAGNISLTSGAGGIDNSATITGTNQLITATGDVTLTGNASGGTLGGARIGGLSGATPGPTNLTLNVSGDVVLTGGNAVNNGVAIGSTPQGVVPQANNIAISTGGSVILNSGAGSVARIGSSLANGLAGGDIAITAGGGIQLNGTAQPTTIRTLGNVTLHADSLGGTISEGTNGLIQANALTTSSNGNTSLTGPNQVVVFNGSSMTGDVNLNNTSSLLTVPAISLAGGGALTLYQAGNLLITGNVSSGAQTISASGDLTVAPFGGPGMSVSASGSQAISAGGTLSVQGRPGTNSFAQIIANDGQTISASNIVMQGGSSGSGNRALIVANNGSQLVNAGAGGITLIGGSGGAGNSAAINQNFASPGLTQTITVTDGGSLSLQGGSAGTGNFAQIRAAGDLQTITAGNTTITAGLGGATNFAAILAPAQAITVHGDLTLTGGGSAASGTIDGGARIGGLGGATPVPTNLVLTVDGDLTMTGGSVADAGPAIGSGFTGGVRTDLALNVGGNVTLNPGSVAGAESRIGSPSGNVAGGNIFVNAGGNIALNSAGPGLGTGIFTLDTVSLGTLTPGKTITEGVDSIIRSDSLGVGANGDINLIGANQVGTIFSGGTGLGGSLSFNNTSPALTVPTISLAGGGALTLNQAGNLFISGNVSSGAQTITATGDITVAPFGGPGMSVSASGAQTISAGGTLSVRGGSAVDGRAVVTGSGPTSVTVGNDLDLAGGSGQNAQALLFSNGDINLTIGGALRLNAGSGENAWARVQTATRDSMINIYFPNLSSGGYFVNDIEGALRRGLTGILSGAGVAVPNQTLDITYGQ